MTDLPSGFEALPGNAGFSVGGADGGEFAAASAFVCSEAERFELVMGFVVSLPTRLEQAEFDATLNDPELPAKWLNEGMGVTGITEQRVLADLDKIGDASVGLTAVADMEGIPVRMDMAVFRRGTTGAFVVAMYIEGDVPVVSIGDLASKLDARIVQVLGGG